jgi:predicted DNA-binding transcriptional regulator YafY
VASGIGEHSPPARAGLEVRNRGTELAKRLEVSERTVQRDVEALIAAGVPIRSARGPAGGYHLEGRYQTRTKVRAALTGEARDRAQRTTERFHLDPVRWYGTAEPATFLGLLSEAVWHDRRIRVTHTRDNKTAERTLDPLGLVLTAGEWYLVAHRHQSLRTYRVSRLTHVEILQEPARRPPTFNLAESWAQARRDLETRHTVIDVTLRIAGAALPRLRRVIAVTGQEQVELNNTSEWVTVTVPFETESWATTTMLGFGSQVEVLAPPSLRARMATETKAAAARY